MTQSRLTKPGAARDSSPIAPTRRLFLERRSYTQRRLVDAVRLLPILGFLLWMVPLIWPKDGAETVSMSTGFLYVFVVWYLLIAMGAVLAIRLRSGEAAPYEDQGPDGQARQGQPN